MRRIKTTIANLEDVLAMISEAFYNDHVKLVAKSAIDKAPSDSGRTKGSIVVSTGSPSVSDDTLDPSGSIAKSNVDGVKLTLQDKAFVTCGVDYASILEFGSDTQSPLGFMRASVNEAQLLANKATK